MLLKAHQGPGQARVMVKDTAKAICQFQGWGLGTVWGTVKHQDREMEVMIHLKIL